MHIFWAMGIGWVFTTATFGFQAISVPAPHQRLAYKRFFLRWLNPPSRARNGAWASLRAWSSRPATDHNGDSAQPVAAFALHERV